MANMEMRTVCCDTLEFDVELFNDDGTEFELGDNDKLWFAVKRDYSDPQPAIYVEQHETHFVIPPADPELAAGIYLYEVGIIFANGKIKTVITGEKLYVINKIRGHTYAE